MTEAPPKILLIGYTGQLGWELRRALSPIGDVLAVGRPGFDLSRTASIPELLRELKPNIVVNAAAYTAVDTAESQPELAKLLNATAPGILAEEARKLNALLIHYSTDYVFDGEKRSAYEEGDMPDPVNVYGETKLSGERLVQQSGAAHFIFRTGWVYGARGANFMRTILRLAQQQSKLPVVDDQIGAPTWSRTLAQNTALVLRQVLAGKEWMELAGKLSGVYHMTAAGRSSWFGFAQAILARATEMGLSAVARCRLVAISTSELPRPARRPQNSILNNQKLVQTFGLRQIPWDEDLELVLRDLCECRSIAEVLRG